MQTSEFVVVGGGAAGAAAVKGYREHGGAGRITLVTDEPTLPYERPPLSKDFLRGDRAAGDLPLEDEDFYRDVDVLLGATVEAVDAAARHVTFADREGLSYAACVVATGNGARRLPVPGGDDPGLHHLRSLADAYRLRAAATSAAEAVVVGSGFVGCEVAASLAHRGVAVTLVSAEERPQQDRLGAFAASRIAGWLDEQGVRLVLGAEIARLSATTVTVAGGGTHAASLVLVAAGVRPRTALLERSGLCNEDGTVNVDAGMRTPAEGLFVAGDIARPRHPVAGRRLTVEHWTDAARMGEVAGANAAGADLTWTRPPGFWSTIGDRTVKFTGWGDGHDEARPESHDNGGFTVWYHCGGELVGALTHLADDDYEEATKLLGG